MGFEICHEDDLIVFYLSGRLSDSDAIRIGEEVEELARRGNTARLLLIMDNFRASRDASLVARFEGNISKLSQIGRVALVCDQRWKSWIEHRVGTDTENEVRFFEISDHAAAERWLATGDRSILSRYQTGQQDSMSSGPETATAWTAETARMKGHWDGSEFGRDAGEYRSALSMEWHPTDEMHPRYVYSLLETLGICSESVFKRIMANYVASEFDRDYAVAFWSAARAENLRRDE